MSEQGEIRACPCCKGKAVCPNNLDGYHVVCRGCGLRTKSYSIEAEAVAAWNQRAGDAELAALRAENKRLRELEQACLGYFLRDSVTGEVFPPRILTAPEAKALAAIGRLLGERK